MTMATAAMQVLRVHGPGDMRLDPLEPPRPGPADIVVRVRACGICGSDLGFVKHGMPGRAGTPSPIGHEFAGEIAAVGAAVTGLAVGDRVVVDPMATPGPLGNGGTEGAFAPAVLVREARPAHNVHRIPDGVAWDVAALAEPLAVSLHGVNRVDPQPGDRVAVFGAGMIGLGVVLWLAERGVRDIVAVDLSASRLERARALGATHLVDASREDVAARLRELHGSEPLFSRTCSGTDLFVDAAGGPVLSTITAIARRHARILILAAYHGEVPVNLAHILSGELTVTAALAYPTEIPDVVAALPGLRDRVAPLVSHRYALDDAHEAFAMATRAEAGKVLIEFADA